MLKNNTASVLYARLSIVHTFFSIIRVIFNYDYPPSDTYSGNGYVRDHCYYLYDNEGKGTIVEQDELKNLISANDLILGVSYNVHFAR